jgi:hypothetical protein
MSAYWKTLVSIIAVVYYLSANIYDMYYLQEHFKTWTVIEVFPLYLLSDLACFGIHYIVFTSDSNLCKALYTLLMVGCFGAKIWFSLFVTPSISLDPSILTMINSGITFIIMLLMVVGVSLAGILALVVGILMLVTCNIPEFVLDWLWPEKKLLKHYESDDLELIQLLEDDLIVEF